MTTVSTAALIACFAADPAILLLLGGAGRVRLANLPSVEHIPEICVNPGLGSTAAGFGYGVHGHRQAETSTAVDCWATTPETANALLERATVLALQGIPGIDPAASLQTTDAAQDPVRKELWHAVLRFPASHHVLDPII